MAKLALIRLMFGDAEASRAYLCPDCEQRVKAAQHGARLERIGWAAPGETSCDACGEDAE